MTVTVEARTVRTQTGNEKHVAFEVEGSLLSKTVCGVRVAGFAEGEPTCESCRPGSKAEGKVRGGG